MIRPGVLVRSLRREDIPEAIKLVLAEGWNQTSKDWELFLNHSDNICKCAEVDGKLAGTTTSYLFSDKVAWVSMVLVDKKFRGRGISKLLLNAVISELKNCQAVKLDATEAGRRVYQKFGFKDEYRICRMVNGSFSYPFDPEPQNSREILKSDITGIVGFDKTVFGVERSKLIKAWLSDFPDKCRVLIYNNKFEGIVLGREGNRFHQIGPVSAGKLNDAKSLILSVLQNLREKSVVVDVMNDKPELIDWLTSIGFEKKREFTRMYLRSNSFPGQIRKQYLIAGPEFG